jgi:tRNA (guanine-N7-)-methyltransferase
LRAGRRALAETLLPRLRVPLGVPGPLDPAALFPFEPREIRLEIGFGAGEHLADQAKANPAVGFIGCEAFVNGVAALLARVKAENLGNVRVFDDDVRLLYGRLPEASLDRVVALFPDPWPKTRHHRRRLIQRHSLDEFARVLKDGGELHFATDHMEYARWTLLRCLGHPAFAWAARGPQDWRARPVDSPETRYETKARVRGRACVYLVFRRLPRTAEGLPRVPSGDI